MSKWQPIETAPKGNGNEINDIRSPQYVQPPKILLYFPAEDVIEVGYWDWYYAENGKGYEGCSAWCCGEYQPAAMGFDEPTHWMPLPEKPISDLIEELRADEWGPNATLRRKAADRIAELEAHVEALQNKCARRGLSPEDSDALQAENDSLRENMEYTDKQYHRLESEVERLRAVYEAAKPAAHLYYVNNQRDLHSAMTNLSQALAAVQENSDE